MKINLDYFTTVSDYFPNVDLAIFKHEASYKEDTGMSDLF
jgi:hypothetical protein